MDSDLIASFKSSMVIDYDKWHDGLGYEIELIDQMTVDQRKEVEHHLREKGITDWRDLEALDRLGTPGALQAIVEVRESGPEELALRAHQYGPPPQSGEREDAILQGLSSSGGRLEAIDEAAEHPSPKIIDKLLECAERCTSTEAYQAALALFYIHGKVDSMHSWDHRPFLLRFVDAGPDKVAAVQELRGRIGLGS